MPIKAYVYWSIYVQTNQMRKLRETHLPLITDALEKLDFDWQVLEEPESPGEFRLLNYQNLKGKSVKDIIIPVMRRAYQLADGWRISGLQDIVFGELRYIHGAWNAAGRKTHKPPTLTSIAFEIEPGQILGRTRDGDGWKIDRPKEVSDKTKLYLRKTPKMFPPPAPE